MSARTNGYFATVDATNGIQTGSLHPDGYEIILPTSAPTATGDVISVSNVGTGATVWQQAKSDRLAVSYNYLKTTDAVITPGGGLTSLNIPVSNLNPEIFDAPFKVTFTAQYTVQGAVTSFIIRLDHTGTGGRDQIVTINEPSKLTAGVNHFIDVSFLALLPINDSAFDIQIQVTGGTSVTVISDQSAASSFPANTILTATPVYTL
jgi:hypothetical protein